MPKRIEDDNPWSQLDGLDTSGLGAGQKKEYPPVSDEELRRAEESGDPLREHLMHMAAGSLDRARAQAEGKERRERKFHDKGWTLAFETPKGVVGLWSSWLGGGFFLGYPKNFRGLSEDTIIRTLGMENAKPVDQVNAIAVNDWNYQGEYKDRDKPLESNDAGQIIAYHTTGRQRLWAKYWGPREKTGGRVWVDWKSDHSNGYHFPHITGQGNFDEIYYGHGRSNNISTYPFSQYSLYVPDAPTANDEAIQQYRDPFILLAARVAFAMGGLRAITADYGFSMVPEDFDREGYTDVRWLKGRVGERKGWGEEIVRGKKGDATVILKSGNSLVPWSTILRAPATKAKRPEIAFDFIKDAILYF